MKKQLSSRLMPFTLAVLIVAGCSDETRTPRVSLATAEGKSEQPEPLGVTGADAARLTESEVPGYRSAALDGDGRAAFTVSLHYEMVALDRSQAQFFAQIAAENGSADGMYSYATWLLYPPENEEKCRRANYWLKRLREHAEPMREVLVKQLAEDVADTCSRFLSFK